MFDKDKLIFDGELLSSKPEINLHIDYLKDGSYVLNIFSKGKIIKTITITKT
ncbi:MULTISPECIES: hypothetical protein [unclassified Algibacter]|uniref:hypothetical protein n=1 Tax=unclassified Algibacter TaxID=2615009 RepID=UPI00131EB16E|nr:MULTISPECIES: hypothetical protein [unclassified Algibacter]MCL5128366.1 hypothetical protein [Algibacter sp. L4_22]